ncbi:sialic acid-binding Ig-like lectin 14 [Corythoichthys intestinalis]|uniref:sialic acid-binding Ig-like lectin 14 n=1 Tax=Corythoichthys intestinalis TaxID=161448 RepID=UPI0025A53749|nr:sialic acid-binding Ig-like lectin 14 [Corythoichthys intestinalis]
MFLLSWATLLYHAYVYTVSVSKSDGFQIHTKHKIVSEVGLCAIIPCSFSAANFMTNSIVWFKCEGKCIDRNIIFHSKNKTKIQEDFKDRVQMLAVNANRWDCGIIINDLTLSDSGSYMLRVNGLLNDRSDGYSFKDRVVLNVTALSQKPIMMVQTLSDGQEATLTCKTPAVCFSKATNISWAWKGIGDDYSHAVIPNITSMTNSSSSLTFNASAEHHRREITCKVSYLRSKVSTETTVTLNVTYVRPPSISGPTTVKSGDRISLTCNVDTFPPSVVTWKFPNSNTTIIQNELQPNTTITSSDLVIPNVTSAHSGRYECTAANYTTHMHVMVTWFAGILPGSGCLLQDQVLTCVCISSGVPLPTVTWPTLDNRTACTVNTVSDDRVNSSIVLIVRDRDISAVECVSMQEDEREGKTLEVQKILGEDQAFKSFLTSLRPDVFIAFLSGALLSAILCWSFRRCCRKPNNSSGSLDMELVATQEDPQVYGLKNGGKGATRADVEYADINFSVLKRNNTREAATNCQATEYSEIKTKDDAIKTQHLCSVPLHRDKTRVKCC